MGKHTENVFGEERGKDRTSGGAQYWEGRQNKRFTNSTGLLIAITVSPFLNYPNVNI